MDALSVLLVFALAIVIALAIVAAHDHRRWR